MLTKFGPGQLRLLLAILVVVEHLSKFQIGKTAVMVFFMLSGYWVMLIYERRFQGQSTGIGRFYISRFLRIWPLYFVVFLFAALVVAIFKRPLVSQDLFAIPIFGIATHGRDLISVSWSLDIELQFYLLVPLGYAMYSMFGARKGLLLALLCGLWAAGWGLNRFYGIQTALVFLPLFAAGAACHLLHFKSSVKMAIASLTVFILFAVIMFAIPQTRDFIYGGTKPLIYQHSFALGWAMLLMPFVAFNIHQSSPEWDRHLGNLSYPLYLLHFPIIIAIRGIIGHNIPDWAKPMVLVLCLVLSWGLYWIVDRWVEKQRLRLNQYLSPDQG